ncbi:MAG: lipocalin family protein [Pyrinomonadaceae bacterium]
MFDFQNIYRSVESSASSFIEGFTDAFMGEAETLRDGSELDPVNLPKDLFAHRSAQTEWWYYTGHAKTESGKRFGYELVFFKRRTDLDKFSIVPVRLLGNPIYFAHFAITDISDENFRYSHRKSANRPFELPALMSEKNYYIRIGDWSVREAHGDHILRASIGNDIVFEASLRPAKKPLLNGKNKNGVSLKDENQASRYFSYTRMKMQGEIIIDGTSEHFTGTSWMDREFGTWSATENQKGWDWFSIQLNNNTEFMFYQLRNSSNGVSPFSSGVYVNDEESDLRFAKDDFVIEPTGYWRSPKTKTTYPSGWKITVPDLEAEITVTPILEDQELDSRGTTMIVYWEGACTVSAIINDTVIEGTAYVELVGYDRSHESPNLAYFLVGRSFQFPSVPFIDK